MHIVQNIKCKCSAAIYFLFANVLSSGGGSFARHLPRPSGVLCQKEEPRTLSFPSRSR